MEDSHRVLEKIRTSQLLQIYGGLLSEKQLEIVRLHVDEDLGFSEIAEDLGITRQAVYDATRQGKQWLEKYERHLGLYELGHGEAPEAAERVAANSAESLDEETALAIRAIEKLAREDIIYDTDMLRRHLGRLKKLLSNE